MKICEKFRQLFKGSSKSQDVLAKEMMIDIQNVRFLEDAFTKKYRKRRDQDIKKISSLTKSEKEKKIELAQSLDSINMEILNLTPLIKRKYEIAHQYMQEYLVALRNSMEHQDSENS